MTTPLDGARRKHPMYVAWRHMKERCDNPNTKDAKNYFTRGISYPSNWKTFEGFYADMGASYKTGLTLDRIDNDESYSVDNCQWATRTQQNNNTRRNRYITIKGVTKTLAQWATFSPDRFGAIRQRYYVYRWPVEKALNLPQDYLNTL